MNVPLHVIRALRWLEVLLKELVTAKKETMTRLFYHKKLFCKYFKNIREKSLFTLFYVLPCFPGKARLQQIGYAIQEDYQDNREEWLQSVVDSLEKDELVNQKGGFVRLP